METTPLDAARDDAHRLHVELAFVPLSLMSAAAGGSAVVGPFVEALSPGAMPLTVQIALVVVAVGNGLCALRARVDQRWAPQIGVAIWLWVIALLPGAGPIGATNPIVLLCMAVGATVGSITAPGSWRWGPIAGLAWLTGQMLVDVAPEARVPSCCSCRSSSRRCRSWCPG
ncbi:MAG: hypothetical protein H6734_27920 [Alphaproteobacteria bacterium]|nr:hypothetical protein [Alphaproteobacteria bacterium]